MLPGLNLDKFYILENGKVVKWYTEFSTTRLTTRVEKYPDIPGWREKRNPHP